MDILTEEQETYIKQQLEPYGFKDIDLSDFKYWAGEYPAYALETFKTALDDFAVILEISRSDIGMNGQVTLKLGFSPETAQHGDMAEATGYTNLATNTLAMRAFNAQSFAHEWGHMFDKLLGHTNLNIPFDSPVTISPDTGLSTAFSDYFPFPEEFFQRTKEFYKDAPEVYQGYLMRGNEMFARMMEMIPSVFCINSSADLTVLGRDARDPELLRYEDVMPLREDQHLYALSGVPSPSPTEATGFLMEMRGWIEEMKEKGIFHKPDIELADVIQKEIEVKEDPFGENNDVPYHYINQDEISVIYRNLKERQLFIDRTQACLDQGMSLDDALDYVEQQTRLQYSSAEPTKETAFEVCER